MKTLPEVETAKQLMNEAMRWSVMTWLREKKRVRKTADLANAALDCLRDQLQKRWPEDLKCAYAALNAEKSGSKPNGRNREHSQSGEEASAFVTAMKLKAADDEAYRARVLAEETFDAAEKRLSTSLARAGCLKAIQSWELHEKAISQAEKWAL